MALAGGRNKQEHWLGLGRSLPPSVLILSSSLSFTSPSKPLLLSPCQDVSPSPLKGTFRIPPTPGSPPPPSVFTRAPLCLLYCPPPNVLSPAFIIPCPCSLGSFCFLCHLVPSGRLELVSWSCKARVTLPIEWAESAACLLQGTLSSALRLQSASATPWQAGQMRGSLLGTG